MNHNHFEKLANQRGMNIERQGESYLSHETAVAWSFWKAARADQVPNEHGKNRYGLDMAYFRNLFNRELHRSLVDYRPDELARVLARAARTADKSVLEESEFHNQAESKLAEAIHYPGCWDTMAYPHLRSAIWEICACQGCSTCTQGGNPCPT